MAEEEEVDCKLDVCVDVEPVEEDIEDCMHEDGFELSEIHLGVVLFATLPVFVRLEKLKI